MNILKPSSLQSALFSIILFFSACSTSDKQDRSIPLPEHPRPDKERNEWINLNGYWDFEFDSANTGMHAGWYSSKNTYAEKILVPFPWGSPLSEVENKADIAWYKRKIEVPENWQGMRVFLVVGASDWLTKGWIDGKEIGEYQGGYTPFEFELTDHITFGKDQDIVLRVDDSPHDFKLFGKQGYGDAKGIWQTVYLEARPSNFISNFYFTPDIDSELLNVKVEFDQPITANTVIKLNHYGESSNYTIGEATAKSGGWMVIFDVEIPEPKLWSLDNPHLYDVQLVMEGAKPDIISTYFGMRKISVERLPGTDIPYVALNDKPIYLQMVLDQAYHPEGFYTFPNDEFVRDEIWKAKEIGLNGQRVHIKVPIPRKLYWADKLGHLIMADVPNSWGQPDEDMQLETEVAMRGMIARDYNHPSIFSWVIFNETWGLFTNIEDGKREYKKETQDWVADMYQTAKMLDKIRLVEDNSPCNYDHVVTDINTWHAYLPGYGWKDFLDNVTLQTYVGSDWNFTEGNKQKGVPMFNSECGNVWGYEGSTGDVDWSWDYHIMINEFRRHPKVAGWLYTEHHDVINEWNGYWKYDRSRKFTGMEELVDGMRLNDLHSYIYLAPGVEMCEDVIANETVKVPVRLSVMTDEVLEQDIELKTRLYGWNTFGEAVQVSEETKKIKINAWEQQDLEALSVKMPDFPGLFIYSMQLVEGEELLHSNFTTFKVAGKEKPGNAITISPQNFTAQNWSLKQWNILDGLKVNGAGSGYFEYEISIPEEMDLSKYTNGTFIAELSSKPLYGKDKDQGEITDTDYMRGKGVHDPGGNPNSYPMTDEFTNPSKVQISINGKQVSKVELEDDPADHRGILSWHAQPRDRKLREAGTFGYLVKVPLKKEVLDQAIAEGKITVRLEVPESSVGGLAIYGQDFGRYPVDPTIVFE